MWLCRESQPFTCSYVYSSAPNVIPFMHVQLRCTISLFPCTYHENSALEYKCGILVCSSKERRKRQFCGEASHASGEKSTGILIVDQLCLFSPSQVISMEILLIFYTQIKLFCNENISNDHTRQFI